MLNKNQSVFFQFPDTVLQCYVSPFDYGLQFASELKKVIAILSVSA